MSGRAYKNGRTWNGSLRLRLLPCRLRLGLCGLANRINVGEILWSARCNFSGDQVLAGDEVRLQSTRRINDALDPALPCGVKIHGRDVGKNIEAARIMSK